MRIVGSVEILGELQIQSVVQVDTGPPKVAVAPIRRASISPCQASSLTIFLRILERRYTLHQHIVLLCLKVRKDTTDRTLIDELIEMPRIRNAIGLSEIPVPSTLCKAFNRLDMAVWRVLLDLSVSLLPTNGVAGIDASGSDRSHASKHYTKRAKLTVQQLKVTLLVDTRANAILDFHITTTRKHDTQIAPSLINCNAAEVDVLLGDKDVTIRRFGNGPRERDSSAHQTSHILITSKGVECSVRQCTHGQRSQSETVNSRLKGKYGAFARSRRWWKQFRELALVCIVHNLDRTL